MKRRFDPEPEPSEAVDSREIDKLSAYIGEGLVEPGWRPLGSTARMRLGSIEAKAYTTWIKQVSIDMPIMHPEAYRSAFQQRNDPPQRGVDWAQR